MKFFILILTFLCLLAPRAHANCYQDDCQNGHGAFKHKNGTVYVGQWQNGKYHGTGTIFLPDGSKYVGQWAAGMFDGRGVLTLPDGKRISGLFKGGRLIAEDIQPAPVKNKKAAAPTGNSAEIFGDFPESSTRLLTAADIKNRTAHELRIILNEIYARHSHIFKSADLKKHFSQRPWYTPKQSADWSMFSDIERANILFIRKNRSGSK